MTRLLLSLAILGLTAIATDPAQAKGGPLHLFSSQLPPASQAGSSPQQQLSPSQLLGGCGRGRYRDPHTNRCRGPADIGN